MQQVLRLLAVRRRDSEAEEEEDEGPFFDLDLSSSVRSSSSSSDESDLDACSESDLDFIISLHRKNSSNTTRPAGLLQSPYLRTLSFGSARAKKHKKTSKLYGGRPSFASSTRSLRLFIEDDDEEVSKMSSENSTSTKRSVSIRRYLTKISMRLRNAAPGEPRGRGHRLRKSRSASAAVTLAPPPASRRDDSLVEKQDDIASAIAHCKESFRRASLSERDSSSLLRSRSDPGKSS